MAGLSAAACLPFAFLFRRPEEACRERRGGNTGPPGAGLGAPALPATVLEGPSGAPAHLGQQVPLDLWLGASQGPGPLGRQGVHMQNLLPRGHCKVDGVWKAPPAQGLALGGPPQPRPTVPSPWHRASGMCFRLSEGPGPLPCCRGLAPSTPCPPNPSSGLGGLQCQHLVPSPQGKSLPASSLNPQMGRPTWLLWAEWEAGRGAPPWGCPHTLLPPALLPAGLTTRKGR